MPTGFFHKSKTHCPQGHTYNEKNTYVNKSGSRCCRECARVRSILSREKNPSVHIARVRDWQSRNQEKVYSYERKRLTKKYGVTEEKYNELLNKQNGVCAICKNLCATGRALAIDHNHDTLEIRGLLCGNCNNGLGRFKDNKDILLQAIEYLTK